MESIYHPLSFRASEPIQTKTYFKEYNDFFPFFHQKAADEDYVDFAVRAELELGNDEYEDLKKSCRYVYFFTHIGHTIRHKHKNNGCI